MLAAEKFKETQSSFIGSIRNAAFAAALLGKRGARSSSYATQLGCELPEDMSDYGGVVLIEEPTSTNDCNTYDGIKRELDRIP